jgi:hypothetical protein
MPDGAQRVGVMIPTRNRPELARAAVLQLACNQSRTPDIVCVHQNGHPESYQWAVADVRTGAQVVWLHNRAELPQHHWYGVPLKVLLEAGCTHFFWADHDDLYLADHVERGLADLADCDFSVSRRCGLLFTKGAEFRYSHDVEFSPHAPGGMSSTMCFNRAFAGQLLHDLAADRTHQYSDNVVAHVTMPKFRCRISDRRTAVYHAHEGSLTSHPWLADVFDRK